MKKKLWLGNWVTTAFHFIELIRNNPDKTDFEIYCTNSNPNSPLLQISDYAELEPILNDEKYIDYALNFCKKHQIEIFIPNYKKLLIVSKHHHEFLNIGVKVLNSSDNKLLEIINDKGKTYESVKQYNLIAIPEYYIVNNYQQFHY